MREGYQQVEERSMAAWRVSGGSGWRWVVLGGGVDQVAAEGRWEPANECKYF